MKKLLILLAVFALVACGNNASDNAAEPTHEKVIFHSAGETTFRLEITDLDGNTMAGYFSTDEATVGEALYSYGVISGEETAFGLMVTEVGGITADFSADGSWWAFYAGGEMSLVGVDQTYVEAGQTYAFVLRQ